MQDIKLIINYFAETYNFLQNVDIERVENDVVFNKDDYRKLDNRKFISIDKYPDKIEISFGRIIIEIDTIDEEEFYTIEKDAYFRLNLIDFPDEDSFVKTIRKECKKYGLM